MFKNIVKARKASFLLGAARGRIIGIPLINGFSRAGYSKRTALRDVLELIILSCELTDRKGLTVEEFINRVVSTPTSHDAKVNSSMWQGLRLAKIYLTNPQIALDERKFEASELAIMMLLVSANFDNSILPKAEVDKRLVEKINVLVS